MSLPADPPGAGRRRGSGASRRPAAPGARRAPRPLSWRSWPLRTRLLVPAVLVLAAVCAVITSVTYAVLADDARASVRGRLDAVVEHAIGSLAQSGPDAAETAQFAGLFRGAGMDTALAGYVARDGTVRMAAVQATRFNQQPTMLTAAQEAALAGARTASGSTVVDVPGLGDYLVTAVEPPFRGGGGQQSGSPLGGGGPLPASTASGDTLVVGLPMAQAESTLNALLATMALLSLAGIAGSALLFSWITRLALRPLDRVAATARRVAELPLHRGEVAELERVPDPDTDPRTEAGQVGAALNTLLDHVGSALAARHASETRVRRFVADAGHELRTPLASIKGYAELTRRGGEQVPPDTAYALRRVESEADRMARLVEDLLLLARLDSGRPLERERVELVPLVVDAVRDAHAAGPRHTWLLDLPGEEDEQPVVVGDAHRLQQVLVNLLANARTHTPPGTAVTASLHLEGERCVLRVADDGPGIPPDLLPRVFERFARGDASRSRAAGSTGLGLAIVSAVVASHGGDVEVQSAPGRTAFTVRLPPARNGAAPGPGPSGGGSAETEAAETEAAETEAAETEAAGPPVAARPGVRPARAGAGARDYAV